jgi:hypothetical protein
LCVFDDFGEVGFHCGFVDVVGNFIWQEEKKSRCLVWHRARRVELDI